MNPRAFRGAAAVLLLLFAAQALWSVREHAPGYDEPIYLLSGYDLWMRGEYRWTGDQNPPLGMLLSAWPLLALPLEVPEAPGGRPPADLRTRYIVADRFLYHNRADHRRLLALSRMPSVAVGVLLGVLVLIWAARLGGPAAGLLALALYGFCPVVVDNASLATNDLLVTAAVAAALFALRNLVEHPGMRWTLLTGLAMWTAVTAKYTGLMLLGVAPALLGVWAALRRPAREDMARAAAGLGLAVAIAVAAVVLMYGTQAGLYLEGLRVQQRGVTHAGQPTFLLGNHSPTGWRAYYLVALGVKLPLPLLMLAAWALHKAGRRAAPGGGPDLLETVWLLLPGALLVLVASLSTKQIGIRYVLPVVPLLCVFGGQALAGAPSGRRMALAAALAVWQAAGAWRVGPHAHAYFNELVGGPSRGYRVLVDADLDWGQDLKPFARWWLAEEGRRGPTALTLSYFGTGNPRAYGIRRFQELTPVGPQRRSAEVNPPRPARELLAISATNLQSLYYSATDPDRYGWLRDGERPVAVVGQSIFVYEVTGRRDVHRRLAAIYEAQGWRVEAARERAAAGIP